MKSLKCLVLLPFDASARYVRDTVHRVLRENKVEPMSLQDNLSPRAVLLDQIFNLLRESAFLIADISRKAPNVFFELGLACGLGKPFILLLSEEGATTGIPSDLMGYQYISYDPSDLSNLATRLGRVVHSVASRAERGR